MTGEKRTETRMRCYNTLCIPYNVTPPLPACIVYDCREDCGVIYIGNTQSIDKQLSGRRLLTFLLTSDSTKCTSLRSTHTL